MKIENAVKAIEAVIENMDDQDRHRIAGAWKTVKRILGVE